LRDAVGTMSEAVLEYRSLKPVKQALLQWLSQVPH
jgi:hypothetical protein